MSLRKLKETLSETLALAKEAETLSTEMNKKTTYKVTLQIPPSNLTPNRRVSGNKPDDMNRYFPSIFSSDNSTWEKITTFLENVNLDYAEKFIKSLFSRKQLDLPCRPQ